MSTRLRLVLLSLVGCALPLTTLPSQDANRSAGLVSSCAWHATDIVIAREGRHIDGSFEVLEVWSGKLKPGAKILVKKLANMASPSLRRTANNPTTGKPDVIPCSRVVLFLRDDRGVYGSAHRKPRTRAPGKEPDYADLDIVESAVWIHGDQVFAYQQNAPSAPMVALKFREAEFRSLILTRRAERDTAIAISKLKPMKRRLAALFRFRRVCSVFVQDMVLDEIFRAGAAAAPDLTRVLLNPKDVRSDGRIATYLVGTLGAKASTPLSHVLRQDLDFFRDCVLAQKNEKPNRGPSRRERRAQFSQRQHRLHCCLYSLWASKGTFDPSLVRSIYQLRKHSEIEFTEQAERICEGLLGAEKRHL